MYPWGASPCHPHPKTMSARSSGTEPLQARKPGHNGQSAPTGTYVANPDASLTGDAKYHYVSGMFSRIARRYDLMNFLMSFGQDAAWRRYTVRQARPPRGGLA